MVPSLKRNSLTCFCLFATFTEVVLTEIFVSTACYGSSRLKCNAHRLKCSSKSVIDIINNTYGYRSGCNAGVGVSSCPNACCTESSGDSFKPFISADDVKVQTECEDKSSCLFTGIRIGDVNNVFNAYSKIEYRCVTKAKYTSLSISINTQQTLEVTTVSQPHQSTNIFTTEISTGTKDGSTVDDEDGTDAVVGDIVGGIVGALVVIGVLLALGFFFFKRKTKQRKSGENINNLKTNRSSPTNTDQHYMDIEDVATRSRNGTTDYYEIHLDDRPAATVTSGGDYDHIGEDNFKKSCHEKDTYNHIGDGGASIVASKDNYHHIRAVNSNHCSETDYNHIGFNKTNTEITDGDEYHHLGNSNTNILTQDNYNSDYNHIGPAHTDNIISDNTDYNHIGPTHTDNIISDNTDYNHIGTTHTDNIMSDNTDYII